MKKIILAFAIVLTTIANAQQKNKLELEYGLYLPSRGAVYGLSYQREIFQLKGNPFYVGVASSYGGPYGFRTTTRQEEGYFVGQKMSPYSIFHAGLVASLDLNSNKKRFGLIVSLETGFRNYAIPEVTSYETFSTVTSFGASIGFMNSSDVGVYFAPKINPYYRFQLKNTAINVGAYYKPLISSVFGQSTGLNLGIVF
ncbi:hypothetical protein DNU06_06165 [Putridiphycobacter roseus]|uniref:Outer membrane protein beta-barrel domain-containing protein n=1 Tax=Putridiphycobacter roseus TaxID=2219161 RepID=A0A2W1NJR4_9FLAO|nr:hypothetical protein [Putridiphycobacter roseus]PZE18196.1 hypothetical protein DNU06_06165 [Putridiphycobacter roseus]